MLFCTKLQIKTPVKLKVFKNLIEVSIDFYVVANQQSLMMITTRRIKSDLFKKML